MEAEGQALGDLDAGDRAGRDVAGVEHDDLALPGVGVVQELMIQPSSSAEPSGSGAKTFSPMWPLSPAYQVVRVSVAVSYFTIDVEVAGDRRRRG